MTWLIVFCSLVFAFGLIIGTVTGINWEARAAARDEREDRAGQAADDFIAALHPPEVHHDEAEARRLAMARRTRPVYRPRRTSTAAFLAPEVAHDEFVTHSDQAMALANDDPSVSAWTQQMAESMDAWLAEHVYRVPYSADELWSGQ